MKNINIPSLRLVLVFLLYSFTTQAAIIHVNLNQTTGNQDGSTWADAFSDLAMATSTASYGDEIWVSAGTYYPTSGTSRLSSFILGNGVKMFGGFTGTEANREERNWEMNETILSGDIGVLGDDSDNSYTVVFCATADTTTTLDGFIISGGNANGTSGSPTSRFKSGGGLYIYRNSAIEDSSPQIMNCSFFFNQAQSDGGAAYLQNTAAGGASPLFQNCIFNNNTANQGGAIAIRGTSKHRLIKIENCSADANSANFGGGIYLYDDFGTNNVLIEGSEFTSNYALAEGGAVDLQKIAESSKLIILHSSFVGNLSNGDGLAIANFNFSGFAGIYVSDCLFDGNNISEDSTGGAIVAFAVENEGVLDNCIFRNANNRSTTAISVSDGTLNINNCLFYNLSSRDESSIVELLSGSNLYLTNSTISQCRSQYGNLLGIGSSGEMYLSNSIIYNNDVPQIIESPSFGSNGVVNISHSLIDLPNCEALSENEVNCGPGMLYNTDPIFADTTSNNYQLDPCSPARNAGDNDIVTQQNIQTDLLGISRVLEDIVDMGAYEMPAYDLILNQNSPIACHGDSSGIINLDVQSGCEPLVLYLGQDSIMGGSAPFVIENLSAGNYEFTAIDAAGREQSLSVDIFEEPLLEMTIEATEVICLNAMDGMASGAATGGVQPYTYQWDNGSTDSLLTDLDSGSYILTITDANDCTAEEEVTISETTTIFIFPTIQDATSFDNADGSIVIDQITGGIPPYSFEWSTGETTQIISNLLPDNYTLLVTDSLGCQQSIIVVVGFESATNDLASNGLSMRVFPNPVKAGGEFTLEVDEVKGENVSIQLLDLRGRLLWEKRQEKAIGFLTTYVAPNESGAYLLLFRESGVVVGAHKLIVK